LVNDSAAHQKQWQSLSPENKTQILCNDADAHRKQCKSFSPGDKNRVLRNDAAAHKRKHELLPPEKKARLMETITEQRHEHLTEEEKKISAQIRSVATILYERVDLDKPTVEYLHEHFYKDPTLTLAYCRYRFS
jgi:hypothetical protein